MEERKQKVEFRHRHGHRRQGHDLCDTETPSMTMIHYNIGQINLLFYSLSSTEQTTKYSVKIFKINLLGARL